MSDLWSATCCTPAPDERAATAGAVRGQPTGCPGGVDRLPDGDDGARAVRPSGTGLGLINVSFAFDTLRRGCPPFREVRLGR